MFNVEATIEKYSEAIHILRDTLFNVDFTEERVRTVISQLLNGIPGDKLSAATVVKTLADNMYFNDKNNIHFSSFLRQQKFLNASLQSLKDDPTKLIRKLSAIHAIIGLPGKKFENIIILS
jgi:Zn-dependent M16 (insulinase) family peptidase